MRAIGVTEYGGPDQLRVVEVADEPLGPGQVRVRVSAFAVNPTDTMRREGGQSPDDAPETVEVPGMDVAGRVVEVGDGVEGLAEGQEVMGVVVPRGEHGAYREDVVLPAASLVPLPDGVATTDAASLPMNALTARFALAELALAPGATLAVTGSAGALGGYLMQLAKADGLRVVADAKPEDEDLVRGFGADVVVARGGGFADAVRAAVPDGVDALADAALLAEQATPVVRDGGGVATFRGWDGSGDTRLTYHPVFVGTVAERQDWLRDIRAQVEAGRLTPRVADVLPAEQAAEAHRPLEAGGVRGRLVLTWS